MGSLRQSSLLLNTENPDIFSDTSFRLEVEAYRCPLDSFPRFVVLLALTAADLDALLGLMLFRRSILGVLAADMKFRLVLDLDKDPMKDVR